MSFSADSRIFLIVTFAYGGASTSNSLVQGLSGKNSDVKVDGVAQQVEMYLSEMTANKAAPNGDLLALFAGGNDAFFGLPTVTGNASAESLMSSVGKLYAAGMMCPRLKRFPERANLMSHISYSGGRSFVLFQLPALQALPYFAQAANVPLQPLFAQFATDFNAALTARAGTFQSEHLDATLNVFDTSSFVKSDLKGYKNTQTACLNSTTEEVCASPKEHVYWDLFHFTSNVHEDIGKAVEKTVKKNR